MKIGRTLGNAASFLPGMAGPVDRLRRLCRSLRLALNTWRSRASDFYGDWVRQHDTPSPRDVVALREAAGLLPWQPTISVVMPVCDTPLDILDASIRSLLDQAYTNWELCIADDASSAPGIRELLERHAAKDARIKLRFRDSRGNIAAASNTALDMATGEFVALLDHDDMLPVHALYWVAEAINRHPDARLLYSDEDKIDAHGKRFDPHFKPDFNYELFLAQNMICHLGVYRRDLICSLGGFRQGFDGSQDYDLALRVVAAIPRSQIVHIPRILYHWRAIAGSVAFSRTEKQFCEAAAQMAVAEHLQSLGGVVEEAPEAPWHHRIRNPLPAVLPLVSIVICTRDHEALLRRAVDSIRSLSTYPHYEIVIVDNGSRDPLAVAYLDSLTTQTGVRVIRDDSPFNYSRLNNRALPHCRGDMLCLLNDDIEVVTPDWLEEMVSFASKPDVGAVGARLWYPDGTLQHGGVIIGIGGVAGHAHPRLPMGNRGYYCRAVLQQELSAVTGACLMVRRSVFAEVGGLDEQIAVAFNDIDLCLRLRAAGYRNIWTPFAELIHHESASRGPEDNPEKIARFQREVRFMHDRWGDVLSHDPHYNLNLSMRAGDYSLNRSASHPARRAA
jgi:glycosyltransferase involved in cell wall biosynthesis